MRSERALGTLGRVFRRLSVVGIAVGIAAGSLWNGCAVTNTEDGRIVDAGMDDGPPPGSDLTCQRRPEEDTPDERFEDSNCDGIDGDITRAIFVSPNGDDTFIGTRETPVKTITQAIKLAQQQGLPSVYADKGTYPGSFSLVAGISVYGGYDSGNLWARSATNDTVIQGGTTAVTGNNLAKETHLELVSVTSANGSSPGQSTYGIFIANSSGPIILSQVKVKSGIGADGASPTNPTAGTAGGNGGNGTGGCSASSCSGCNPKGPGGTAGTNSCLGSNVSGGKGGDASCDGGGAGGAPGSGAAPGNGGSGGSRGDCVPGFYSGKSGSAGTDGGSGLDGNQGGQAPAVMPTNFTVAGYNPSNGGDGTAGSNGSGGGGGGAGGGGAGGLCNPDAGGGGGGAGAGGCAAPLGKGGGGGGGSFGLYIISSTVTVNNATVASGQAGNGGKGANGATGGSGGSGAAAGGGSGDAAGGGRGGNGGKGGNSGAGAGGTGGPSYGIYAKGSQVTTNSVQASAGAFGSGGNGGTATLRGATIQAAAGAPGQAGPLKFD